MHHSYMRARYLDLMVCGENPGEWHNVFVCIPHESVDTDIGRTFALMKPIDCGVADTGTAQSIINMRRCRWRRATTDTL